MKEYFTLVKIFREELLNLMDKSGIKCNKCKLQINPFYHQIVPNGSIGVEFYYGYPYKIYTPLGEIQIWDGYAYGGQEEEFLKMFLSTFKAVQIKEKEITNIGEFGPIYAITHVNSEKIIPSQVIFKEKYTVYETAMKLFEIYTN